MLTHERIQELAGELRGSRDLPRAVAEFRGQMDQRRTFEAERSFVRENRRVDEDYVTFLASKEQR
jgi:hypothetical protein